MNDATNKSEIEEITIAQAFKELKNRKKDNTPENIIKEKVSHVADKIADKSKNLLSKVAGNIEENQRLNHTEEYLQLKETNQDLTKALGAITLMSPILGSIVGPAILLFNLGLDKQQLTLIGSLLFGNIIASIISGWIGLKANKASISISSKNAFRIMEAKVFDAKETKEELQKTKEEKEELQKKYDTLYMETEIAKRAKLR